ncbi:MAG: hypothetical protein ACOCXJ_01875, partial [Planctomycetota bacterium]
PPPPPAAVAVGLLAAAAQWLVDYSLFNPTILATVAAVWLAGLPERAPRSQTAVPEGSARPLLLVGLMPLILLLGLYHLRAADMRSGTQLDAALQNLQRAPDQTRADDLAAVLIRPPVRSQAELRQLIQAASRQIAADAGAWPTSLQLQRAALRHAPPQQALPALQTLAAAHPLHHALQADLASAAAAAGAREQAIAAWRRAIDLAPAVLRHRYRLWLLLPPGPERAALAAEIIALQERVHIRNTLPAEALERLHAALPSGN